MDFLKCKTNFQEYINTEYGAVEQCIKIFKDKMTAREDVYEDLYNGSCIKITQKKERLYNKTYDPRPIIENFKKILGEDSPFYLNFLECCNTDVLEGCCNCISVVLYITDYTNWNALSRFLFTIEQSIMNVNKYLPDWVYRLYLDPSVFESIEHVKTLADLDNRDKFMKLYELYLTTIKNIASNPNCEIYLTYCSNYLEDPTNNIGKRRNNRFSGFYELDVNINASREADGLIETIDCYNLKLLENEPFASLVYHMGSMPGTVYFENCKYGDNKDLIFSLSAGLIALKFKFKLEFYENARKTAIDNFKKIGKISYQAIDECLLIELFKNLSYNRMKDDNISKNISHLFGIIHTSTIDKFESTQNYYINIDGSILNKFTGGYFEYVCDNYFYSEDYLHP